MKVTLEKHENKINGNLWYSVFTDNSDLHGVPPKHFDDIEDAEAYFNKAVELKGVAICSTIIKEVVV